MNSKAKSKPVWSYPEFYFGIVSLLAYFSLPFVVIQSSLSSNMSVAGHDFVVIGSWKISPLPKNMHAGYQAEANVKNPAITKGLLLIPLLSLYLICFCRKSAYWLNSMIIFSIMLVLVGFVFYLGTDCMSFQTIKVTKGLMESELFAGNAYRFNPQIFVGAGVYLIFAVGVFSFIFPFLAKPRSSTPVLSSQPSDSDDDPFGNGKSGK